MTEQWQELKETIIEMRDNDGTCTQQETCKFLANYMEVLEKQMQEPCEDCISREAVKALIKRLSFKYYMECGEYIGEDSREVTLINALKFEECFEDLPPVKPKYTDEEIDKAQAVEQAYVDKMVELAVEESRREWLNSFDTSSATKCFEAVNILKQRLEGEKCS